MKNEKSSKAKKSKKNTKMQSKNIGFYHEGGEPLCSLDDLEWSDDDLPIKKKRTNVKREKLVDPVRVPIINFDFIFDEELTRTLKRDIKELE